MGHEPDADQRLDAQVRAFGAHDVLASNGFVEIAASRRFVALSAARLKEWMARDFFGLDLLVIQIDGVHMDEDMIDIS